LGNKIAPTPTLEMHVLHSFQDGFGSMFTCTWACTHKSMALMLLQPLQIAL
jgi:hypothetical protein